MPDNNLSAEFLGELAKTVAERAASGDSQSSYTSRLLAEGIPRCAQKLGEEATEVVIAATTGNSAEMVEESADLLYHLLVLWQATGTDISTVMSCLRTRHEAKIDNS